MDARILSLQSHIISGIDLKLPSVGEFADPIANHEKIFVPLISGQAGLPQIYLANQRSTNHEYNHYTQSNLLVYYVPLLSHINNCLI